MSVAADGLVALYVSNPLGIVSQEQTFHLKRETSTTPRHSLTSLTSDTAPSSAIWCSSLTMAASSLPPSILYGGHVNGSVSAWSARGALLLEVPQAHAAAVTRACCLSTFEMAEEADADGHGARLKSEGPDLATASLDATIRIWQLLEDERCESSGFSPGCLFILDLGLRNPVADLVLLSPEEILVATWDGQVRFVDLMPTEAPADAPAACSRALQVTMGQVRSICKWRKKGEDEWQLFAGTDEGTISCWAPSGSPGLASSSALVPSWSQRLSWQGHWSHVIALSSCKDWLISCAEDKHVRLWDATSGKLLSDLWGHSAGILCACVSWPLLWTGSRDHTVRSWDLQEIANQLRELSTMETCDAQSFHYEITFSRLTAKQLKKLAAAAKAAKAAKSERRNRTR